MSVGPRATNGLDNARERGLAMCDDLGLKAEPNKQFSEIRARVLMCYNNIFLIHASSLMFAQNTSYLQHG
jgi:hypothetical protein